MAGTPDGRDSWTVIVLCASDDAAAERSLNSVRVQTLSPDEIIVAGPREPVARLAERAGARDQPVRAISLDEECDGRAVAAALAASRGSWVKLLHAGDVLHPACLAREREVLGASPAARAVFSVPQLVDDDGAPLRDPARAGVTMPASRDADALRLELLERDAVVAGAVSVARDAALATGVPEEAGRHATEYALWLLVAHRHEVVVLDEPLVRARPAARRTSAGAARDERVDVVVRLLAELRVASRRHVRAGAGESGEETRMLALARALLRSGLRELVPYARELVQTARADAGVLAADPAFATLLAAAPALGRAPAWRCAGPVREPEAVCPQAFAAAAAELRARLAREGELLEEATRAAETRVRALAAVADDAAATRAGVDEVRAASERILDKLRIGRRLRGMAGLPAGADAAPGPAAGTSGSADPWAALRAELRAIVARHPDAIGTALFAPTLRWSHELFQRPHQLARELARRGYLVFFAEGTWHPDGEPAFRALGERLYASQVPIAVFDGLQEPLVFFLSYNAFDVSLLDRPRTVYELIDELEVFRGDAREIRRTHERLLTEADVVVATAARLHERVVRRRPDALLCPNAVDEEHFRRALDPSLRVPDDLAALLRPGHPVLGYYGALASWVDYELLRCAALARPDVELVLIGPDYDGSLATTDLLALPNVHRLDARPYAELPAYLRCFDVATIPFVVNDVTESTSPIKLFEYMAAEKPVVTTPMRECRACPEVLIAHDGTDLVAQLDAALGLARDPAFRARLAARARGNTWGARVDQILAAVAAHDGGRRTAGQG